MRISEQRCTACAGCAAVCPVMAIRLETDFACITEQCIDCGRCEVFCPVGAVSSGDSGEAGS